jgi:hydrogenase small subunit
MVTTDGHQTPVQPTGRTTSSATRPGSGVEEVHILWTSEGMSCDGDSVSITAAMQPSLEDVVLGLIPGLPKVTLHNKVLAYSLGGDEFMQAFHTAARGELDAPFVLVVEGSIPNEKINGDGYWTSMGNDPATGQPITLNEWIDRLAPKAWAVVAIGTCAAYGGIHAMAGNPTGSMGLCDYLGWNFRSAAGIPIVNVPGCPVQPDNFMETLTWLLYQAAGLSPMIPLDDQNRPTWLFGRTVHEGCDRAGYYEQSDFAEDYNKFMPFMDEPPGGTLSTLLGAPYGTLIRRLRSITGHTLNQEPKWRHNRPELTTDYNPRWPR